MHDLHGGAGAVRDCEHFAFAGGEPRGPNVVERVANAGVPDEKISFDRDTYSFIYPASPSELLDAFRTYYGPTMNAFEAAEANGRTADLQNELEALFNGQNASPSNDTTSIPATFLRVTVAL